MLTAEDGFRKTVTVAHFSNILWAAEHMIARAALEPGECNWWFDFRCSGVRGAMTRIEAEQAVHQLRDAVPGMARPLTAGEEPLVIAEIRRVDDRTRDHTHILTPFLYRERVLWSILSFDHSPKELRPKLLRIAALWRVSPLDHDAKEELRLLRFANEKRTLPFSAA